jgi:hypothetical protein
MKEPEIFYASSTNWFCPIIIAIAIYIINHFLGLRLFNIHYYFAIVGLISLLLTYSKYALLNDAKCELYYGLPTNCKTLNLEWNQISLIELREIETRGFANAGSRGGVPFIYHKKVILIKLKDKIPENIISSLDRPKTLNIMRDKFKIVEKGQGILLLEEPKEGFARLLKSFSKYHNMQEILEEPSTLEIILKNISFIAIMIPAVLFFLWMLNSAI